MTIIKTTHSNMMFCIQIRLSAQVLAVFLFNDPLNWTNVFLEHIFFCAFTNIDQSCVCTSHACRICFRFICTWHPIQYFPLCFFVCSSAHAHGKWREAWKSEKRSAKGYEVEKKGMREHLKADFGNMEGQQLPKIVPVTAGYCLTCP